MIKDFPYQQVPHRYVSGNSSVTHIWNTIGVSNGRHLSSYMCKVSQDFHCGRKQAAPDLLNFVRAKTCITLQSQSQQSKLKGMYILCVRPH